MSIGEKRHRVTFETATITQDAYGEPDQTWTALCTSWALVQPMKGAELFSANQVQSDVDYRIVTRNRSELHGLAPGDRATWTRNSSSSLTFDIRSVVWRDHRDSELEILAKVHS